MEVFVVVLLYEGVEACFVEVSAVILERGQYFGVSFYAPDIEAGLCYSYCEGQTDIP